MRHNTLHQQYTDSIHSIHQPRQTATRQVRIIAKYGTERAYLPGSPLAADASFRWAAAAAIKVAASTALTAAADAMRISDSVGWSGWGSCKHRRWLEGPAAAPTNFVLDRGLQADALYAYRVRARNHAGWGPWSKASKLSTPGTATWRDLRASPDKFHEATAATVVIGQHSHALASVTEFQNENELKHATGFVCGIPTLWGRQERDRDAWDPEELQALWRGKNGLRGEQSDAAIAKALGRSVKKVKHRWAVLTR